MPESDDNEPSGETTLALDEYERSNLAWLLRLVSNDRPFSYANTGDWVAQVLRKLGTTDGQPNQTREQLLDELRRMQPERSGVVVPEDVREWAKAWAESVMASPATRDAARWILSLPASQGSSVGQEQPPDMRQVAGSSPAPGTIDAAMKRITAEIERCT